MAFFRDISRVSKPVILIAICVLLDFSFSSNSVGAERILAESQIQTKSLGTLFSCMGWSSLKVDDSAVGLIMHLDKNPNKLKDVYEVVGVSTSGSAEMISPQGAKVTRFFIEQGQSINLAVPVTSSLKFRDISCEYFDVDSKKIILSEQQIPVVVNSTVPQTKYFETGIPGSKSIVTTVPEKESVVTTPEAENFVPVPPANFPLELPVAPTLVPEPEAVYKFIGRLNCSNGTFSLGVNGEFNGLRVYLEPNGQGRANTTFHVLGFSDGVAILMDHSNGARFTEFAVGRDQSIYVEALTESNVTFANLSCF